MPPILNNFGGIYFAYFNALLSSIHNLLHSIFLLIFILPQTIKHFVCVIICEISRPKTNVFVIFKALAMTTARVKLISQ